MMKQQITLGKVIRGARQAKGLTREGLAVAISCSISSIGHWERNETRPRRVYLKLLSRKLGINLKEVIKT